MGAAVTAAAAATVISLTTPAALAATWTVSPGGSITGTSSATSFTDSGTGNSINCTGSTAKGTLKSGSGLSGSGIGSISSMTFSGCTGSGFSFTVTAKKLPWTVNAVSYNSTTGVTTGTITGVSASLASIFNVCTFSVDGSGGAGTGTGSVTITYTNSTGVLKVTTPQTLTVYNPSSGCMGKVKNGDSGTFSGSYTLSPKQTITSP